MVQKQVYVLVIVLELLIEYRNLMIVVDNVSDSDYTIEIGDRLCQAVCFNGTPIISRVVDELDETSRNKHGFGSTGK